MGPNNQSQAGSINKLAGRLRISIADIYLFLYTVHALYPFSVIHIYFACRLRIGMTIYN